MMNNWFYFALLSPAIFAIVNLIDDNLLRGLYKTPFFGSIISGFFGLLPLLGLFFFPFHIPSPFVVFLAILGGFLNVMYYMYYFKALAIEVPSVVIALFGFSPAITPFLAYFILGETLSLNEYLGFTIVLASSFALSVVNIYHFQFSKAFIYILFASSIYAVIAILQKLVYDQTDFFSGYVFFSIGLGIGALFLSLFFKDGRAFYGKFRKIFKKWIGILFLVELIGIAAELTNNYAISKGSVSLVKVIEGTQPMYVLLFAILLHPFFPKFFREAAKKNKLKKLIFMLIILVGLYFIHSG